jgi:NAD(P)-dependent dehydrogenase (short-subunit alcohol dehydrogenase family)
VIARRLAENGASVVVADVQEERVKRTARLLQEETGRPFLAVSGDLSREGVAEEMVAKTLAEFGRIDTLVNKAAALIRMRLIDFTEELLQKAVDWNVWNTLRCCKAVLPTSWSGAMAASSISPVRPGAGSGPARSAIALLWRIGITVGCALDPAG